MGNIPQKVYSRISEGLKRFQPIVESAKSRDVNESDTVVLLTGILSEILGFDKYTEVTTEVAIRGTYCDLALKIDGKICILIEAKAVGIELKEHHAKQAIDYGANKGIEWIILTNSVSWKVFKINFTKPIQATLVCEMDFLKLKPKAAEDIEMLFVLSKEAICKSSLDTMFAQKQATNKFMIGNLLLNSDTVLSSIKKELKLMHPDIKVTNEEIAHVLTHEVLKREIMEGEEAEDAKKKIIKANKKKDKLKDEKVVGSNLTPTTNEVVQ
jgi:type I restriction and modification enzyme subunit R-like protein